MDGTVKRPAVGRREGVGDTGRTDTRPAVVDPSARALWAVDSDHGGWCLFVNPSQLWPCPPRYLFSPPFACYCESAPHFKPALWMLVSEDRRIASCIMSHFPLGAPGSGGAEDMMSS